MQINWDNNLNDHMKHLTRLGLRPWWGEFTGCCICEHKLRKKYTPPSEVFRPVHVYLRHQLLQIRLYAALPEVGHPWKTTWLEVTRLEVLTRFIWNFKACFRSPTVGAYGAPV